MVLHVLHIGKTGGSALTDALSPHAAGLGAAFHGHDVRLRDVPAGDPIVFLVRNPVTRFVSGFNSRLRKGAPRNFNEWTPAEARTFTQFATPGALADALASEEPALRDAAKLGLASLYHPARHLTFWLESPAYLAARRDDIFFVGRTESLDADFAALARRLGLPGTVVLRHDLVGRHATPPGFDTGLSPAGTRAIADWYAPDAVLLKACLALRASILGRRELASVPTPA